MISIIRQVSSILLTKDTVHPCVLSAISPTASQLNTAIPANDDLYAHWLDVNGVQDVVACFLTCTRRLIHETSEDHLH